MTTYSNNPLYDEYVRRQSIWNKLIKLAGSTDIAPALLRQLGIYGGQQGIFRDLRITKHLSSDGVGVAVSFLHTGRHYDDDLSSDTLIYHYPETDRPGRTDKNEISAAKNACRFRIPVFVITYSGSKRNVKVGQILEWDDKDKIFLVQIMNYWPDAPYSSTETIETLAERRITQVLQLQTQRDSAFRKNVLERYGPQCSVCTLNIREMLQAAHILPVALGGSDDPRNGIVLCANHHVAFDAALFVVDPESLAILPEKGYTLHQLKIERSSLRHLNPQPLAEAFRKRLVKTRLK